MKAVSVCVWLVLGGWLAAEEPKAEPAGEAKTGLTKAEATEFAQKEFAKRKEKLQGERKAELVRKKASKDGSVTIGVVKAAGKEMRALERTLGEAPESGYSLWISMHGGGGAPKQVNDRQWLNQIGLYSPKEGIYVAPRAPTDTWNLWHEGHMDDLIDRMIENYVIDRGVDPDRVYLMGYSAGGDGVFQLAPRMADRFAAASMMAGHPNDASPLGLRNLPFALFVGKKDTAYKRNEVVVKWGKKLEALREEDGAGGYQSKLHVYDTGHWMDRKDAVAVPWMAAKERTTWPKRLVWHQSGRTHERFYWLALPKGAAKKGQTVRAAVDGQKVSLTAEGVDKLVLRLHDELVNLDEEIEVEWDGVVVFRGKVPRTKEAIRQSLEERLDAGTAATALLEVSAGKGV